MKNFKKFVFVIPLVLLGMALTFLLNYFYIEKLIITDECYYHGHTPNILIQLFYSFEASNGDHPFPSIFNVLFTLILGGYFGYKLSKYLHIRYNIY